MAKQRQSRYIHVLIIIVGILGGYMYNTTFAADSASSDDSITSLIFAPGPGGEIGTGDGLEQFANKNLNLSVLEDSTYQSLQIIGEAEVSKGITGRSNIFAPF